MSGFKLQAKLFITGQIELKTGMHIGGSTTALDIGGIDSNVIKTAHGEPYIPGSSLKGKMRSLIGRSRDLYQEGYLVIAGPQQEIHMCNDTACDICNIFGRTAGKKNYYLYDEKGNKKRNEKGELIKKVKIINEDSINPARLYLRDAFLDKKDFDDRKANGEFSNLELDYTEGKWENTIDRMTSAANPRQLERVPAGAKFLFAMVYNIYEDSDIENLKTVIKGMRLLQDDYLGGSGSRGYGQIEFKNINFSLKTIKEYEKDNQSIILLENQTIDLDVEDLKKQIREKLKNGAMK